MGLKAKSFIEAGKLVPDDVVIGIIKERLADEDCNNGFILDGFPRTIPQAEALDNMGIIIDKVVDIDVPDENIVNRMSGRRVCKACGSSYHIENKKPKVEGVCDNCGGELQIRKDDAPETVLDRLNVYHEQTEPLKDYYAKCGKLRSVEGTAPIKEITASILKVLGSTSEYRYNLDVFQSAAQLLSAASSKPAGLCQLRSGCFLEKRCR